MKDNVRVVECVSKMSKVMNGSGFAVTSAMGGIALLATTFPPKTHFLMSTIAQNACKITCLCLKHVNKLCFNHVS